MPAQSSPQPRVLSSGATAGPLKGLSGTELLGREGPPDTWGWEKSKVPPGVRQTHWLLVRLLWAPRGRSPAQSSLPIPKDTCVVLSLPRFAQHSHRSPEAGRVT